MILLLLIPSAVDFLRVRYGLPFMTFLGVSVCLVIWLTKAFVHRKFTIQYSPLYFVLLLIGATAFLSITSPIGDPLVKLYRTSTLIYSRFVMVFLLVNLIRSFDQLRRAIYMVIGLAALSALIALWQFWMYEQTGINYSFAEGDQTFRVTPAGTFLRATALATDPNGIGEIMAVAGVWCLYLGLSTEGLRPLARLVHYLPFLILGGGVVVTFSRSALLSLLVGLLAVCLTFLFVNRPSSAGRLAALFGVLGVGAVVIGGLFNLSAIFGEVSEDVLWRIDLNQLGLRAVLDNPITGVGIDGFIYYNNPYDLPVHNLFIQVASELGIPGLFFFLVLIGSLFIRLVMAAWQARDSRIRSLLMALTIGYGATLLTQMGAPILLGTFFWLHVGLIEAAVLIHRSASAPGEGAIGSERR